MEEFKIGDHVVRADGANHCIGVITHVHEQFIPVRYHVSGLGWEDSYWTYPFIIKHDFEIGDIVLPNEKEENHNVPGRVTFIEENGNMTVKSHFRRSDRRYWSGSYSPGYLQRIDKMVEKEDPDELTPLMLELYLA